MECWERVAFVVKDDWNCEIKYFLIFLWIAQLTRILLVGISRALPFIKGVLCIYQILLSSWLGEKAGSCISFLRSSEQRAKGWSGTEK